MAPELLQGERYDESVDIYALGVLINECLQRETPYQAIVKLRGYSPHDLMQQIIKGLRPDSTNERAERLVRQMWHHTPSKRPHAVQIAAQFADMAAWKPPAATPAKPSAAVQPSAGVPSPPSLRGPDLATPT